MQNSFLKDTFAF